MSYSWRITLASALGQTTAKTDQRDLDIALYREELRLKDARMSRIPAHRRPHYQATERLAILELRAARGWASTPIRQIPPRKLVGLLRQVSGVAMPAAD